MYNLQQLYPVLNHCTYLNTAAHGLISTQIVDYKTSLNQKLSQQASGFTDNRGEILNKVRSTIAGFLDAHYHLTALVPNFSLAFNALLEGIDSSKKFLLVRGDYPSVNLPIESRGFECCFADLNSSLEQNIWNACEQQKPDFLALSVVQYISGIKLNLDFLKDLKVQFPDLIIIADGTQFIGVEEFRFRESAIDILAASCYKWLNAGDGNAFITFKEEVVGRIKPKYVGFDSTIGFKNDRGTFIGHFEPGHQDIIAFAGLQKAIEFVNDYGINRIEKQIKDLSQFARAELTNRNLLDDQVIGRKNHSSIFNITGDDSLFNKLRDQQIVTSLRGNGLRVSFTYYNTMEDLQKLLNVIDDD